MSAHTATICTRLPQVFAALDAPGGGRQLTQTVLDGAMTPAPYGCQDCGTHVPDDIFVTLCPICDWIRITYPDQPRSRAAWRLDEERRRRHGQLWLVCHRHTRDGYELIIMRDAAGVVGLVEGPRAHGPIVRAPQAWRVWWTLHRQLRAFRRDQRARPRHRPF